MTEGVIVIPFFIAVWLGIFSVYCYFTARIDAQGQATSLAYEQAMDGECKDVSADSADMGDFPIDDDDEGTGGAIWNTFKDVNPLVFQHVSASATVSYTAYSNTRDAKGSRYMLCNSTPADNLLSAMWDTLLEKMGIDL